MGPTLIKGAKHLFRGNGKTRICIKLASYHGIHQNRSIVIDLKANLWAVISIIEIVSGYSIKGGFFV